jgi:hypothetical protein
MAEDGTHYLTIFHVPCRGLEEKKEERTDGKKKRKGTEDGKKLEKIRVPTKLILIVEINHFGSNFRPEIKQSQETMSKGTCPYELSSTFSP